MGDLDEGNSEPREILQASPGEESEAASVYDDDDVSQYTAEGVKIEDEGKEYGKTDIAEGKTATFDKEVEDGEYITGEFEEAEEVEEEEVEEEEEEDPIRYPYGRKYRPITGDTLREISQVLSLIKLVWPEDAIPNIEHRIYFPESYRSNSKKEKLLLWHAENFRKQFHFTYPERRPLILAVENECGLQKMVCTTIRPTALSYPEMYDWEGCAKFIADHLNYVPLMNPITLPSAIRSSRTVLDTRYGSSFEYSILLCSYLIGTGYDAYVVSGYATREFCLNDQRKVTCPHKFEEVKEEREQVEAEPKKYEVKPPKDLRSKFIMRMEEKARWEAGAEQRQRDEEERRRIEELERIPPDELYGYRVHSWVLILPGSREVSEPFFIESVTGVRYEIDSLNYLGLESIWNCENYWVSLQDCIHGCGSLQFDLCDTNCWEHLLVGEPWHTRKQSNEQEEDIDLIGQEKHLDMPQSWVDNLLIKFSDFECRYPPQGKTDYYKKVKVERFGPYVHWDGLIMRITKFADYEYTVPERIYQYFQERSDRMISNVQDLKNESITETFGPGREDALREYWHKVTAITVEGDHRLQFYYKSRLDGLEMLEMHVFEMIESYKNRPDFLEKRNIYFDRRARFAGIDRRFIMRILEKFGRNPEKPAKEDIMERDFAGSEDKIKLKYHYEDNRVTAATREFIKPLTSGEEGEDALFHPELTSYYQVDPFEAPPKQIKVYRLFESLLQAEDKSHKSVRDAEDDLGFFLKQRSLELAQPMLSISAFDPLRNESAKEDMVEKEKTLREESERVIEKEVDYLAPYMERLGNPEELSQETANRIRHMCLLEFKQRLVERVNQMQVLFEETTNALEAKHRWYEEQQDNLTREDEEEYFNYCNRTTFFLHTLEIRINRHRDLAPQRYLALESYLRNDKRLSKITW